jgi:hypothetical protein
MINSILISVSYQLSYQLNYLTNTVELSTIEGNTIRIMIYYRLSYYYISNYDYYRRSYRDTPYPPPFPQRLLCKP